MLTLNAALRFFFKNISSCEVKKRRLLLPGSVELIREETKLEELGLKNGLQRRGTFRMLMQKICDSEAASGGGGVDVVLVDLGRNNGGFNKVFAMSCDYILSKVHAEYFSAASVTMFLDNVLSDWQQCRTEHIAYLGANPVETSDIQSSSYYCFESPPKVLPFISQGYEMSPTLRAAAHFLIIPIYPCR